MCWLKSITILFLVKGALLRFKLKGEKANIMPTLSIFFGIIVRMYNEQGGQHNRTHIHAEYQNYNIVVDLDGNVIEGNFPKNKLKLLDAWIEIHREDLLANWKLLSAGDGYFKIEPLR